MRLSIGLLAAVSLVVCASGLPVQASTTINFGDVTYTPSFSAMHFAPVWNLMAGDLTLSYRIDLGGVTQSAAYQTPYVEVGIRKVGAGDFNPGPFNTYQGGAGGWMTSLVGDLATNPNSLDMDDKHNLSASGGRGEGDYDATAPGTVTSPFGTTINYGIWFDRDGVDQWQATYWGSINGSTYNTGGVYDIVITYHAINSGLGTMFATVNGVPTGFYTAGWKNAAPDIYPAGLSFTGDMTAMQVFTGAWWTSGAGGSVYVHDITVTGSIVPEPVTVVGAFLGISSLGAYIRRRLVK